MPTGKFVVEISASRESAKHRSVVVANSVKYLAYADTTDLFGYHGKIETVDIGPLNEVVTIGFVAPIAQESDIQAFLDECETLARVERAECLTNPNL